jgi:hypothetical protein
MTWRKGEARPVADGESVFRRRAWNSGLVGKWHILEFAADSRISFVRPRVESTATWSRLAGGKQNTWPEVAARVRKSRGGLRLRRI